jgi:hypothetical protein
VHRFALLTAVFVVWLGMFAATLPAAAKYPDAEDEWLPERYTDIDEASWQVGYHIPVLHNAPGWRMQGIFVAWRGDTGLVDVTYVSDGGALLTLSVNRRRELPPFIKGKDDVEEKSTEERVRFAGRFTRLVTYRTSSVEVMTTQWVRNGMPITATAFVYPGTAGASLTKQQLLDALETLH